jgi:hypothetical protein
MAIRFLVAFAFVVAACSPSPAPSQSPSVAPSGTPVPSVTEVPSITPSVAPSVEPSVQPSVEPSVEPSASPVALEFTGKGSENIPDVELPALTYSVTMRAAVVNATSCSIDVALIPETGDTIEVGGVTSAKREATVTVDVPAGTYVLEVRDPSCEWSVEITGP